jgi:hypothetical protein
MARNGFFSLAVAAVFSAAPAFSAGPSIGVATALGSYSVDSSSVTGNAQVFDGTQLRTTISPSDVHLANGADVRMATRSDGTLFSDHLELRDGALRVSKFDGYPVQARQLQIQADTPGAEAIVRMRGRTVEVASLGGTVRVTDGGVMLTRVASGTKMAFQNTTPPAGQTGASPGQAPASTGAAPAPEQGPLSNKKAILWGAGVCAVGGLVVGLIAAEQGKSPFH